VRQFLIFTLLMVFAYAINAAKITDNTLKIGTAGNDIKIISPDGGFLKKSDGGDWLFSADGVLEKKFGTGSGGGSAGILLIENAGFEDGHDKNWILAGGASGQTVTSGTDLGIGEKSAKITYTASGSYCTDLVTKPNALGFGCMASIRYKDAGTDHKLKVYDGSSNVLAELDLLASAEWTKTPDQTFECKAQMKLCAEGVSGSVVLEDAYLGDNKNFVTVQEQAKFLGKAIYNLGSVYTGSAISSFTTPTISISSSTLSGILSQNTPSAPSITIANAQKGSYQIQVTGAFGQSAVNQPANFSIYNGTQNFDEQFIYSSDGASTIQGPVLNFNLDHTADGNLNIDLQVKNYPLISSSAPLTISVYYYPDASQSAWYPEAQGFYAEGSINGGTVSTVTSGIPNNASLTLNNKFGSAFITCSDGTLGSSTCSTGNEEIGIAYSIRNIGKYKTCFSLNNAVSTTGFGYKIARYDNVSTFIEYGSNVGSIYTNTGQSENMSRLCSVFDIQSKGIKSFKIYTSASGGAILADGSNDGRNIGFSMQLISEGVNKPYILNQVDTAVKSGVTSNICKIYNNGTATIETGDDLCSSWITSVNRFTNGQVAVVFKSGYFGSTPSCNASGINTGYVPNVEYNNGSAGVQVNMKNTADAFVDGGFTLYCGGQR